MRAAIYNNGKEHKYVRPEIAVQLKALDVPQVAKYWYLKWVNSGAFVLNRSYQNASKYYAKIIAKPGNEDFPLDIYAAYSLAEMRQMLVPFWKKITFPSPVRDEAVDTWRWEQSELGIVEEDETDATGQLIIELIKRSNISVNELYVDGTAVIDSATNPQSG